jgi:phosphoglycolate phosphatase-like HAD superfamily hydrolase
VVKPLASWNDGAAKSAIVDFVTRVTKKGAKTFVPREARIAVFDNDGTLWAEKPLPIQNSFLLEKLAAQAAKDPALRDKQPWKAAFEKDHRWFDDAGTKHYKGDDSDLKVMGDGMLGAYAGEDADSFAAKADKFLSSSKNPALKRRHIETTYLPMRELLRYLESKGFSNYIVSGGGRDFMRTVTQKLYGIPPERVIGTTVALEYRVENGVGNIYHLPKLEVFDDGPNKPVRIWSRIGARPILVAGNSNGDLEMMEYVATGKRRSLCLLVSHDDYEREMAYAGGAEKALATARERKWTTISMRGDWKKVFA